MGKATLTASIHRFGFGVRYGILSRTLNPEPRTLLRTIYQCVLRHDLPWQAGNFKSGWLVILALAVGWGAAFASAADEPPSDLAKIVATMEQVMRGDASYSEMTMRIVRPRYEREISLRAWQLNRKYTMILVTSPARDRGTAFLLRENNVWTYDPRIDRTTRLPSSMMAQPWMGSDFTNDDLVRDSDTIDDYTHELLRTEDVDGRTAYVIRMVPKPDRPIVWGKVKMWICVKDFLQLRVENYDQRDQRINTMILDRITRFNDREIPSRITVAPEDTENERTILLYEKIDFDVDLDESFFTQRNMQRLP